MYDLGRLEGSALVGSEAFFGVEILSLTLFGDARLAVPSDPVADVTLDAVAGVTDLDVAVSVLDFTFIKLDASLAKFVSVFVPFDSAFGKSDSAFIK